MKNARRRFLPPVLALALFLPLAAAGADLEPLDGRNRTFQDPFLENLAGRWILTRTMRGRTTESAFDAEWVLNHQFLRIRMKDTADPPYEAHVYVGYDNASDRYVAHWLDVFGGRFSETLGYGRRSGNSIEFVFEYGDGPFRNRLTWDPGAKTWSFLLTQKDASGKWTTFSEERLRRAP
jgi:hypothetical protein